MSRDEIEVLDPFLFANFGVRTVEQALAWSAGERLRAIPGRETLELPSSNGVVLYLKKYRPLAFSRRYLWESRRERAAFSELKSTEISVPHLVACGEKKGIGAFLLWRGCRGVPVDLALERGYPLFHGLSSYRNKLRWIQSMAALVAALHSRKLVHHDLYGCHILWEDHQDETIRLHLIDLQRVQYRSLRRWFIKDLAALDSSMPVSVSRADRLRFLLQRLGKKKLDGEAKQWVRWIRKKSRRILSHKPRYG